MTAGMERLRIAQERLIARGVRDVKFTPAFGWSVALSRPMDPDQMANDLAALLEEYLDGKLRPVTNIDNCLSVTTNDACTQGNALVCAKCGSPNLTVGV